MSKYFNIWTGPSGLKYYDQNAVVWLWNFFLGRGMTVAGVTGLMGNLYVESHCCPFELEGWEQEYDYCYEQLINVIRYYNRDQFRTRTYKYGTKKGFGLAQWTYPTRKNDLWDWDYARAGNTYPTMLGDMVSDAEFLVHEMQTGYPGVWNVLTTSNDVRTCSNKVLHDFESPEDQSTAVEISRYNYSLRVAQDLGGITPPPVPPGPGPTPDPPTPDPPGHPGIPVWMLFKMKGE